MLGKDWGGAGTCGLFVLFGRQLRPMTCSQVGALVAVLAGVWPPQVVEKPDVHTW